jgi:hypothetical protein
MSSDNYYEINTEQRADGSFRFGLNMGFDSDEHQGPLPNTPRTAWFDDLDAAHGFADDQYAEYGTHVIRNEAYLAYLARQEEIANASTLAKGAQAERARILALLEPLREQSGQVSVTEIIELIQAETAAD